MSFAFAKSQSINNYKYVVVDNQYEFQQEPNQYRFNEFLVFEMAKYNIEAYRNIDELPFNKESEPCKALYLTLEKSGFLSTKLDYAFRDCYGTIIVTLPQGLSREKDFQKAYFEATRDAFSNLKQLNYSFEGAMEIITAVEVKTEMPKEAAPQEPMTKTPTPKAEEITVKETGRMDYRQDSNTAYSLKFNESGDRFDLYYIGAKVGSGRKSAAGVYLVTSASFSGIGFMENASFIIEYDKAGALNRIKLQKVD